MRVLLVSLILSLTAASAMSAETKRVCVDQKDAKTQKVKQVCKDVKVHKKLEGTKVPEKKK